MSHEPDELAMRVFEALIDKVTQADARPMNRDVAGVCFDSAERLAEAAWACADAFFAAESSSS